MSDLNEQEMAEFVALADADLKGRDKGEEKETPSDNTEETVEDASTEAKAEDSKEQPEADAEPEPLELEKATAALRRAGFDDDDIKAMSRSRIMKRGMHLAGLQSESDRVFTAFKGLESKVAELEKAKSEKPNPPTDELAELQKTLTDEHGEAVAAALVEVLRKQRSDNESVKAALAQAEQQKQIDKLQRALVEKYPESEQPDNWADILALAERYEANEKLSPAACLEKAASKLKLRTRAEIARASNADKNGSKLNGTAVTSTKKIAGPKPNSEEAKFAAWEARMNGAPLETVDKILNGNMP